ncbi:hypothetical protein HY988_07425 [Candidatus Micrarchaeota archaeon]|nr:hypothetical protein [Candidatus Micrarchaeota archaeon]
MSKLAKQSDTTYVYISQLIPLLAEKGLLTIEPKGNKRMVKLTDKGMAVAKAIDELKNLLPG